MPSSPTIKGTLLEINENKIKMGVGSGKALDITLDKPIDAKVGEDIVINRRNVIEFKLVKQADETAADEQVTQNTQNKYDYILESFNIPINDESVEAVESLDSYGVNITKENILSFISAKEQLSDIGEKLDYNTAVRLVEKDVDFEKESLQKVLQEVQKVQGEKHPFSFLRFLGIKRDMTTEEAEKIAYEIYGNKTGKDITDIIKALDKAGLDTSKKNIEAINNVFSKLHNIKDIENKTIIDSVKNKIETSIDNLYKLKNAIARGAIKVEQKLGRLAGRVYGAYSGAVSTMTEKELTQIEGDIKNRLQYMGIKVTDEAIKLSKDVIAKGLDLTKENLQKIMSVRGAIVELNSDLDYEKTAFLMASGVEVEKVEVVELTNMINVENIIKHIPTEESIALGLDRLEMLEQIENIDIKTLALHMKLDLPTTLEGLNLSQQLMDGDITVDEWSDTLSEQLGLDNKLGEMERVEPTNIQAENVELTNIRAEEAELDIPKTEQINVSGTEQSLNKTVEKTEQSDTPKIEQLDISEKEQTDIQSTEQPQTVETLQESKTKSTETLTTKPETQKNKSASVESLSIDKIELSEILDKLVNTETGTVRGLDFIVQGYLRANGDKLGALAEENYKADMVKAIIQSGIPLNNNNMQEMYMLKRALDRTIENLTIDVIQNISKEGISLEKVDLKELVSVINLLNKEEIIQNVEVKNMPDSIENSNKNIPANVKQIEEIIDKMKGMVDVLKQIPLERKNTIISLLMKNAIPLTLKEVQNLSFFLSNQRQIGHQLDEILNLIDKNNNTEVVTITEELKKAVNKINSSIKQGKQIEERPYEEFSGLLKELESKSSFLTKEDRETLQKSGERLLDSLELQLQLNREDTVLQFPLMMSEYLKNLQIYIMKDKKGKKKIDPKNMSILLNFDTNNMGNVNIYVAVNYKNIVMKMGLSDKGDQNLIERYSDELEGHLQDLGYDLKDLSFRISDDNHILSMANEMEKRSPEIKRLLDVMI